MGILCESQFWDYNTIWNTEDPYFTPCFEQIYLRLAMILLLLVSLIVTIFKLKRVRKKDSCRNILKYPNSITFKILVNILLLCVSVYNLLDNLLNKNREDDSTPATFIFVIEKVILMGLDVICLVWLKKVFSFQLGLSCASTIIEGIILRTLMKTRLRNDTAEIHAIVMATVFPLTAIQFLSLMFLDIRGIQSCCCCSRMTISTMHTLFYSWMDGFLFMVYRGQVKLGSRIENFASHLSEERMVPQSKIQKVLKGFHGQNLGIMFSKLHSWPFVLSGWLRLLQEALGFAGPELLSLIIKQSEESQYKWRQTFLVIILLGSIFTRNICGLFYWKTSMTAAVSFRAVIYQAISKKCLRIKGPDGSEILNILGTDCQKIYEVIPQLHNVWIIPLQLSLAVYLLSSRVGFAFIAVVIVFFSAAFLKIFLFEKYSMKQKEHFIIKDERIKNIRDIIIGFKVIKMFDWWSYFEDRMNGFRLKEDKLISTSQNILSAMITVSASVSFLAICAVLGTHSLIMGNKLEVSTVFAVITIINLMSVPVATLPALFSLLATSKMSYRRISDFLKETCGPEINDTLRDEINCMDNNAMEQSIIIQNGAFEDANGYVLLSNLNLRIQPGELVVVTGDQGAGKSALLQGLLGNLKKTEGKCNINGTVAYVPQTPWVFDEGIRSNIVFHAGFEENKYKTVLELMGLEGEELPSEDIRVGTNGALLSGGQRQRVALARAAYSQPNIFLLDNPFSALDVNLKQDIFHNAFSNFGSFRKSTRVICCNDSLVLENADLEICILNKSACVIRRPERKPEEIDASHTAVSPNQIKTSICSEKLSLENASISFDPPKCNQTRTDIKFGTWNYIKRSKSLSLFQSLTLIFLSICFLTMSNIWISIWSSKEEKSQTYFTPEINIIVICANGIIQAILLLGGSIILFRVLGTVGKNIHAASLNALLAATVESVNSYAVGYFINLFSKDVDTVDYTIPQNAQAVIMNILLICGSVVQIGYAFPLFLVFLFPIAMFYICIQSFYSKCACHFQRLESTTRTPIYNSIGEIVSGQMVIKCHGVQRFVLEAVRHKIEYNRNIHLLLVESSLWIKSRLDMLGLLLVAIVAVASVTTGLSNDPSLIGLAISSAIQITQLLNYIVKMTSDLETNSVAVERLDAILNLQKEAVNNPNECLRNWPTNGKIVVSDLVAGYSENGRECLNIPSCQINSAEKIAVLGRSGAGKSTFLQCLLRIIEPTKGSIKIDRTSIMDVSIDQLRKSIAVVPQETVLFSGTLRDNLDPNGSYDDSKIWMALENVMLKNLISSLPGGLLENMDSILPKLSNGDRQLLGLVRVLLKETKILILDEATADCDENTGKLFMNIVKESFKNATVIAVSHNLQNIMDFDKVMILKNGKIVEYEEPSQLIRNECSQFYEMMKYARSKNIF